MNGKEVENVCDKRNGREEDSIRGSMALMPCWREQCAHSSDSLPIGSMREKSGVVASRILAEMSGFTKSLETQKNSLGPGSPPKVTAAPRETKPYTALKSLIVIFIARTFIDQNFFCFPYFSVVLGLPKLQ